MAGPRPEPGRPPRPWSRRRCCRAAAALGLAAPLLLAAPPRPGRGQGPATPPEPIPPLRLGLVWSPAAEGRLAEGVELACDALNRAGGVLGRRLELVRRAVDPALADPRPAAVAVARELAERGDVFAVIGHHRPEEAIPASITYERHGLIFLNPTVTRRTLNEHAFLGVFSTIPNDGVIARQVAAFAFGRGYRRFVVLRSREDSAHEAAVAFADRVARLGLTVAGERSFTPGRTSFQEIVADLGALRFDAVLVAAGRAQTAGLIRQSRSVQLEAPFLVARLTDAAALAREVGPATAPVAVPILFNPESSAPEAAGFRRGFEERYGREPDDHAAQGYDAVRLLAAAIGLAGRPDRRAVATVMRYTLSWKGVTGRHSFERNGAVYTKVLKFVTFDREGLRYHDVDE